MTQQVSSTTARAEALSECRVLSPGGGSIVIQDCGGQLPGALDAEIDKLSPSAISFVPPLAPSPIRPCAGCRRQRPALLRPWLGRRPLCCLGRNGDGKYSRAREETQGKKRTNRYCYVMDDNGWVIIPWLHEFIEKQCLWAASRV